MVRIFRQEDLQGATEYAEVASGGYILGGCFRRASDTRAESIRCVEESQMPAFQAVLEECRLHKRGLASN